MQPNDNLTFVDALYDITGDRHKDLYGIQKRFTHTLFHMYVTTYSLGYNK